MFYFSKQSVVTRHTIDQYKNMKATGINDMNIPSVSLPPNLMLYCLQMEGLKY